MQAEYVARVELPIPGSRDYAEVTVMARPSPSPSRVSLSPSAKAALREIFGEEAGGFEQDIVAGIMTQIAMANVAKQMPNVSATSFEVEVIGVQLSGKLEQEAATAVLTMAGMESIAKYLIDWESEAAGPGAAGSD